MKGSLRCLKSAPMITALPTSLPVLAMVEQTKETFAGQMVGEELVMASSRGSECRGRFRMVGLGYGSGNLRCSDGRFGNFTVHMSGGIGTAYGTLDGRSITITLG